MSVFLECRGLTKVYKSFGLGPLDLSLEEGWFHALVGPNGAGKTTFLRTLLTLAVPNEGELRIWGMDPLKNEVAVKSRIGFVLDNQFGETGLSWVRLGKQLARYYHDWDDVRYRALVKRLGLASEVSVNKFSKGNQNALALACALAHNPDFLILDEPTAGLDPAARAEVFDLLREFMAQEGKTVLFSTHLIGDIEALADQVHFLAHGTLKLSGTPPDLLDRYHLVKTRSTAGHGEAALIGPRPSGTMTAGLTTEPEAWAGRPDSQVSRASLEEIFAHLIRDGRS